MPGGLETLSPKQEIRAVQARRSSHDQLKSTTLDLAATLAAFHLFLVHINQKPLAHLRNRDVNYTDRASRLQTTVQEDFGLAGWKSLIEER